jgi:hypothetical protein
MADIDLNDPIDWDELEDFDGEGRELDGDFFLRVGGRRLFHELDDFELDSVQLVFVRLFGSYLFLFSKQMRGGMMNK